MADALRTDLPGIARYRRLSGVPVTTESKPIVERILRSKWTWAAVVVGLMAMVSLIRMYLILSPDTQVEGGVIPGLNNDALREAARYALPTVGVWALVFLLVDRWRPQRLLMWLLVLVWGGSIATYFSLVVNTWAADRLSVSDTSGNQLSGARAAIYIAPFVEEFAKASVLFLVAFLDRQRLTSKLSLMSLAGLAAIGFAFTENIVYYARAIVYGSYSKDTGDVQAAVDQLVILRGLFTSFGHPLFTAMTGLGLAIGLRSRSKIVRVVAPVAGFCTAALLHMIFNTTASLFGEQMQQLLYFTVAIPMVITMVVFAIRQVLREGKIIRARMSEYALMGWLPYGYVTWFGTLRKRGRLVFTSFWWGNPWATYQLERTVVELAYLRDAINRGIVDAAGLWRERELFARIKSLRDRGALEDATGLRPYLRRPKAATVDQWPAPSYPGPAGLGGNWPSPHVGPSGSTPLVSSASASAAVDPTWGPPKT